MNLSPKIVAILAGGKARRFNGKDKGEILIGGERLIDIIQSRLKQQSDEIIISGTHDYGLGLEVISDTESAPGGPVGGVYAIWKKLKGRDVEGFFTVAVDGPNLPNDLISKLYSKDTSKIAADELGSHPTYGWWRIRDLNRVFENIDPLASISLKRLSDKVQAESVPWEGRKTFLNINRPDDLQNV